MMAVVHATDIAKTFAVIGFILLLAFAFTNDEWRKG